jgi:hypothetical protein
MSAIVTLDPSDHVHKTCLAQELETHTCAGWQVVAMFHETHTPRRDGDRYDDDNDRYDRFNGSGRSPQPVGPPPAPVTVVKFLLRRPADSVLAQKTKELAEVQCALQEERRSRAEAKRLLDAKLVELEKSKDNAESAVKAMRMEIEMRTRQTTKLRQYEVDLGKLRQAIGDLKFREILGVDDKA